MHRLLFDLVAAMLLRSSHTLLSLPYSPSREDIIVQVNPKGDARGVEKGKPLVSPHYGPHADIASVQPRLRGCVARASPGMHIYIETRHCEGGSCRR